MIIKSISFVPGDPSEEHVSHSVTWCKLEELNLNPDLDANFQETNVWFSWCSHFFLVLSLPWTLRTVVWSGNPKSCKYWASLHRLYNSLVKVSVTENLIFPTQRFNFININISKQQQQPKKRNLLVYFSSRKWEEQRFQFKLLWNSTEDKSCNGSV